MEQTNPVTSYTVVLQDGDALTPKAIIKNIFFFKMVALIVCGLYTL